MSKITGIKKSPKESVFNLEKKNSFLKQFKNIIDNYDFYESGISDVFNIPNKSNSVRLSTYYDFITELTNENITLNVIFGHKKIFIIARGSKKTINEFNKLMFKNFEFSEKDIIQQ